MLPTMKRNIVLQKLSFQEERLPVHPQGLRKKQNQQDSEVRVPRPAESRKSTLKIKKNS